MVEIELEKYNHINTEDTYSELCNIDVLDCTVLDYKKFFEKYMFKNVPCIIKNINSDWECVDKWIKDGKINYEYFVNNYGHLEAPVADCNNVLHNSHCKSSMKITDYINYLQDRNKNKLLYLKDWHLKRLQPEDAFYKVPLFFCSDWLNEFAEDHQDDDFMFVYIGPENSWTPLHADVYCSYSWSVNVVGKKKWILFPPGEEDKLKDKFGNLPMLYDQLVNKGIKHFEVIQEKGDAIFVPSGWYHQVLNMLDTISINHNWVNSCNVNYVWEALLKNLKSVEHEIEEFKETEEFVTQCQLILKSDFGMDIKMFVGLLSYIGNKRLNQMKSGNFKSFQKNILGRQHIIIDLITINKLIDKITTHSLFSNTNILLLQTQNELINLNNSILQYIKSVQ